MNIEKQWRRGLLVLAAAALLIHPACGAADSTRPTAEDGPKVFVDTSALKPAANFKLVDLEGKTKTLLDYKGKVVILDFWATWCGPCKLEIPHFIELQDAYGAQGLEIVGVSLDNVGVKAVGTFAEKFKINYPILMGNNDVVSAYGGVRGIPTAFVITQDGKIFRKYVGYREKKVFESDIRALLGLGSAGAEKS
jgi:thiol-disulfide isomerase/thioredoxin